MTITRISPPVLQSQRVAYRKLAFAKYPSICAYCGFGIKDVLEVAHIDGDRANNALPNLVILCPTCHKMHDLDLIPTLTIIDMRDGPKTVSWKKRIKDAGAKAAASKRRRLAAQKRKWRRAALKAVETRARNSSQIKNDADNKASARSISIKKSP